MAARTMNPIPTLYKQLSNPKPFFLPSHSSKLNVSSKKKYNLPLQSREKNTRSSGRRLIRISTSEGRWQGNWNYDYLFSLQDLQLQDLVEDQHQNAHVSVSLSVLKHASFGFSVDGRIITSFTRKCTNCSSPYCKEIDTNFNVWVLPSGRDNHALQQPEIGGEDPSVIYVKPGCEADLDSLVKDTIRLTTSVKDTCSESCEKSESTLQYVGIQNVASIDKRWSRLLELKK